MNISKYLSIPLCVILATLQTLIPRSAFAGNDKSNTGNVSPPNASPAVAPIGKVESAGQIIINGRAANNKEEIRNGEVLGSPNASAQVTLNGIGKVLLSSGSEMKLNAAVTSSDGDHQRRALVATLIQGKIIVILNSDSEAYIQSSGEVFVARGGSEFRLTSRQSGAVVAVMKGDVHSIGNWAIELSPPIAELLGSIPSASAKASPLQARSKQGSVSIPALVEGAREAKNNVVTVTDGKEKFWTKKNAIPVLATAAAIVTAIVVVVTTRENRLPIKGRGPVDIIP